MVALRAPATIETARLILSKAVTGDAEAVFAAYASDAAVPRHLGWPRHRTIDDTRGFLPFSTAEWERCPAGPSLVCARGDGRVLGGSGLAFETPQRGATGYVLARDARGGGDATETLRASVTTAGDLGVHRPLREGTLRRHSEFSDLEVGAPRDVLCYATVLVRGDIV